VENHKDYRSDEFAELLRRIGSPYVGACVDTGNNLALLEPPLETVEALAPFAFSCHLKDMAVEPCPEGFLLSEVPIGSGFLDLPRILAALRKARPEIRFNLEMITRDPLVIPCLTDGYWATLAEVRGRALARALALVRDHPQGRPLPRVSALSPEERLAREDENVRASLRWEGMK
jgi:sugar phosphate isomerase/epimerase